MLDEYLSRKDVLSFINELETNPLFHSMDVYKESRYGKYIGDELALYTFYDALLKYKIIINDVELFNDYFWHVQKLFRKMNKYDDLVLGINKIICSTVSRVLGVSGQNREGKIEIITFIYNKYIVEGYYYHGFSTVYENSIKERGFEVDSYYNFYYLARKINTIFSKYGIPNIIRKDFDSKKVYFTDDFIMGCHYSITSPNYFYSFLFNDTFGKRLRKDGYLINSYSTCINNLKRFMSNNLFNEKDKNEVFKSVKTIWDYIHNSSRRISILLVKRNLIEGNNKTNLDDLLNSNDSLIEIIDRIFSPKNNNVSFSGNIAYDDVEIISLNDYYRNKVSSDNSEIVEKEEININSLSYKFLNAHGNVSIFVILGSLMITLGVIISIISVLRGM